MKIAQRKRDKQKNKSKLFSDIFADEPRIELLGNREIIVEGCKGVVEYDENTIRLSLGENVLSLCGDDLVIKSFDSDIAVICGSICEISFAT